MEPEQPFLSWRSAMNPVDMLIFSASETSSWTERWFLDVNPIWHVETKGIPAINQTSPAGKRFPEYHPYPGEALLPAVWLLLFRFWFIGSVCCSGRSGWQYRCLNGCVGDGIALVIQ